MFSAAELSEIGVFMDLAIKEANTQTDVCLNVNVLQATINHFLWVLMFDISMDWPKNATFCTTNISYTCSTIEH